MIGIYKITSPTGKIYIGQSINIEKRFKQYSRIQNCDRQTILKRSLEKYSPENHIFEIIEECDTNELNNRERYWQEYYDVLSKNGLNCVLTGSDDKVRVWSEETIEKITISMTGKIKPDEVKKKISNSMKGRKHSKETKIKMSIKRKELFSKGIRYKTKRDEIKTIYQYDLNNNLIKEWDSFRNIIDSYPKGIRTIWKCLRNEQKTSLNYIWSYTKLKT